ncbi:hypothetical protein F0U59_03255 [Archangium gephyra]|nr:hypothetical protein F0U59_03255 [Archangium gephyra]
MRFRACIALLLFVSACATSAPSPREPAVRDPRLANLQQAATLPWTDGGRCAVREASEPWPVLVERCFHGLDHDRIEFHDITGRCAVASAGAAAVGLGVCVLAAPEIVVGAVIVTGVVVVGFAIKEALDAYELSRGRPEVRPAPETRPVPETEPAQQELSQKQRPKPGPKGPDFPPLGPIETSERERRRKCDPFPVPHRGGDDAHNKCADKMPNNSFPGWDVFVNGKNFDALQLATRTLWEVKTDDFDIHSLHSQRFFAKVKLPEIQREKRLAEACGYNFAVGVRSDAHKAALLELDPELTIVVMDWC